MSAIHLADLCLSLAKRLTAGHADMRDAKRCDCGIRQARASAAAQVTSSCNRPVAGTCCDHADSKAHYIQHQVVQQLTGCCTTKPCRTHHDTELQGVSATGKGSQKGALLSPTLVPIPVFQQLAACIVALGGCQLPMHVVLCHDVMVAINGTEDQSDWRQRLGPAGLAVAERVQPSSRCSKVACIA
jgi:hypothetical protein